MQDANEKQSKFFEENRGTDVWDKLEKYKKNFPTHQQSIKKIQNHIEAFKRAAIDMKYLLENLPSHSNSAGAYHLDSPLIIKGGLGKGRPEVNDISCWLNGDETNDMCHETFHLELFQNQEVYQGRNYDPKKGVGNFCKTARKPYDLVVCVSLLIYKHYLKTDLKLSSDGNFEDWKPAIELYESLFKRTITVSTYKELFGEEEEEKPAKKSAKKKEPAYKNLIGKN